MAAQPTESDIQAGVAGDIGSNVGSSSNGASHMDWIFQTPEKTLLRRRRLEGQSQDVDVAAAPVPRPRLVRIATSPGQSVSPGSSSALRRKILNQLTPSSDVSTPSWYTAVDGPLTPETAKVVSLRETPRTPVRVRVPFGGSADFDPANTAATPTPGKTCLKWMKARARMKKTSSIKKKKPKSQKALQPQPQRLTFL
eukprot:s14_g18.t1